MPFILTPPPRFGYRLAHKSAPSGQSQRACARAACKAISYESELRLHETKEGDQYVLGQEIPESEFNPDEAAYIELKAGEVSLHNDALIHGSGPNPSDRLRVGLTARYSSTDVKCDLSIWPNFRAYLVRGQDDFNHNPDGIIPTEFGAPDKIFPE